MHTSKSGYEKQSLTGRNFLIMVIGQIISLFGNAIIRFALPLYILQQTGSAALFGMVSAISFLPMIAMSLIGGILADRINKQRIMVALDFLTAGLVLTFILLSGQMDAVVLVTALMLLLYGIQGAYTPAVQASIPLMMREEKIMQANAVINLISSFAGLLGPVVGGLLFGVYGLPPIVTIGCVSFFISAVMELFLRIPHTRQREQSNVAAIVRSDLKESLGFIRREKPILMRVMLMVFLFNLTFSCLLLIGLPVIVTQTLGRSSELYGITQGLMAAGGLAGGVLSGVMAKRLAMGKLYRLLILCASCLLPIGICLLIGTPSFSAYLVVTGMSFIGMALATIFSVQILSYVQIVSPAAIVGKVVSTLMAVSMCAQPIGQAVYGLLFDRIPGGEWAIVLVSAAISLFIAVYSRTTFQGFHNKATAARSLPSEM